MRLLTKRQCGIVLLRAFCRVSSFLPLSVCSHLGAQLAFLPRRALAGKHEQMKEMIRFLRPDLAVSPRHLERAARRVWSSTARNYAELPVMLRKVSAGHATISGQDILEAAVTGGRPVIFLFVHTGNWEITCLDLALRYPGKILAIYAPPGDPEVTAIVMQLRKVMPILLGQMSPLVWRRALEHLGKPGAILWVAADEWEDGRVRTPFFGRPPRYDGNLSKVVRLSRRTGAIVVPLYSERHGRHRIRTNVLPSTTYADLEPGDAALRVAVDELEARLAGPVVALLDQWYMAPHVGEPVPRSA